MSIISPLIAFADNFIPANFLKSAFEISLIILLIVCFLHSWFTHGWKRTIREFIGGFVLTACCESIGVLSGAYIYPGFHFYILATPIANPASWVACVYVIIELTNRLVYGRKSLDTYHVDGFAMTRKPFALFRGNFLKTIFILAVVDACLALAMDITMDPLATVFNWWVWVPFAENVKVIGPGVVNPYNFDSLVFLTTPPNIIADFFGRFFPHGYRYPNRILGIPLINFLAWFIFVFVLTFEFRWVEFQEKWGDLKKTLVLWSLILLEIPLLAVLLIAPNI